MDLSSRGGPLCLEVPSIQSTGEDKRQWFPVLSACLDYLLDNGFSAKDSVLKAEKPSVFSCCKLARLPPKLDTLHLGQESQYFSPERVLSSGSRRSTSSLKLQLVLENEQQELSGHLLYACTHGLSDAVRLIVNSSHDIDLDSPLPTSVDNEQGLTPLSWTALSNHATLCGVLVKGGAGLNVTDCLGRTALHWAVLGGCLGTVRALLKLGAQCDIVDSEGFTPLHYGCVFGLQNVVSSLLKEGLTQVDLAHKPTGATPLMLACSQGHSDTCKLLLKHHASPLLTNDQGLNPLHCSVWGGSGKCLKTLLGYNLGVDCRDKLGRSPLNTAASMGDHSMCQLLLKKGADLRLVDNDGRTCLHWAILSGEISCIEFLLGQGSGLVNQADHLGATPAHYAAIKPSEDVLILLKSKEADLSPPDSKGYTPLLWAAVFGGVATVGWLLSEDNDRGSPNHQANEYKPLHAAACVGAVEVCQLLLDNDKERVYDSTMDGYTALHYASRFGHTACVQLLLGHGAKVDTLTELQETSLHLSCLHGHAPVTQDLLLRNARQDISLGEHGEWPIHIAARKGHTDVLEVLIGNDSSLIDRPRKSDDHTPLHIAASNGHLASCKLLVSKSCNTNATANSYSALDLAMLNDHMGCADYLMSCGVVSLGGLYHRAASTIQAVWKYHRYKVRKAINRRWSVVVIQRTFRQWQRRRCALRVRLARHRHWNRAALIIQRQWRVFIGQKRNYEVSYAQLRARLQQETLATTLILSQLHLNAQSVSLPPPVATRSRAFPTAVQHGPSPKYLFQATSNPAPIFPSGSLLFPAKPRKPLVTIAPPPPRRIKYGNPITSPPSHLLTIKESTSSIGGQLKINSGEKARFPPLTVKSTSLVTRGPPLNQTSSKLESSSSIDKLPQLPKQASLVSISSETIEPSGEPAVNGSGPLQDSNSETHTTILKKTSSSIKLPSQAQLKLSRQSTFKDTPLKCRPVISQPTTAIEDRGLDCESLSVLELASRHSEDIDGLEVGDTSQGSSQDSHESDLGVDGQLLNNIQRYDKLNQVLTLLHQAKDGGNNEGEEVKMSRLKDQIISALDEAVRLRAETEAMQEEVKPPPVSAKVNM